MTIKLKSGKLKLLVTGGAGFIGGCLIRRLLEKTNSTVFNLDKISYSSDLSWLQTMNNKDRHQLLKVDLANIKETKKAIKYSDPDLIIHLAAESHVDRSIENAQPFINSNILGTFNLLESAKEHWLKLDDHRKNNFRFLHVSTDEVYGSLGNQGLFNEESPYDPRSPYSASKAASDHLVNAWFHTFKFPIIKTNCSNNFGPFQFPEKLIPLVILKAINSEKIPIYGDGKNIRDGLFVEDHIDALIITICKGEVGKTYCIGGGNQKTNIEMVNKICGIIDKKLKKKDPTKNNIIFVSDRPGHDKRYAIDSNLIKFELGWKPKHTFEDALKKTIYWYVDNLDWCKKVGLKSNYSGERLGLSIIKLKS